MPDSQHSETTWDHKCHCFNLLHWGSVCYAAVYNRCNLYAGQWRGCDETSAWTRVSWGCTPSSPQTSSPASSRISPPNPLKVPRCLWRLSWSLLGCWNCWPRGVAPHFSLTLISRIFLDVWPFQPQFTSRKLKASTGFCPWGRGNVPSQPRAKLGWKDAVGSWMLAPSPLSSSPRSRQNHLPSWSETPCCPAWGWVWASPSHQPKVMWLGLWASLPHGFLSGLGKMNKEVPSRPLIAAGLPTLTPPPPSSSYSYSDPWTRIPQALSNLEDFMFRLKSVYVNFGNGAPFQWKAAAVPNAATLGQHIIKESSTSRNPRAFSWFCRPHAVDHPLA